MKLPQIWMSSEERSITLSPDAMTVKTEWIKRPMTYPAPQRSPHQPEKQPKKKQD